MKLFKSLVAIAIVSMFHSGIQAQNCTLTCPANIITKADPGMEGALVSFPAAASLGVADCGAISYSRANGSFFRLGSHSVIVTSATGQKCSFTVTVTDNEAPMLSPITLSRTQLWPASNKMKKVNVFYTTGDKSENVKTELTVSSNATDGIRDWEIIEEKQLRLKASRLADGSPRVYTITVTASDESGNKTTRSTTIAVSNTMTAIPATK